MIMSLPIGILQSNCCLVYDKTTRDGAIVDPGGDTAPLMKEIEERGIEVRYIINTHGHFDHVAANGALQSLDAPLALHPADRDLLAEGGGASWFDLAYVPSPAPDIDLHDGQVLTVGELHLHVVHTPGHTPGSICLYIPEDGALITGDTLFAGSVGRTDLPQGNPRALTESLKKLLALDYPPETKIYPGHGPTSTLARERQRNPWLRRLRAAGSED
ncbi:MAG: MBL fold metallo-hydrolase [Chloroflexi bacterium]|jgi:glyoxylase-like metal-dependent hydrolase (beta-lactamase superfamily II)|nr:MBL fold metallo-hydrolase [Chloroflexota bacterium]